MDPRLIIAAVAFLASVYGGWYARGVVSDRDALEVQAKSTALYVDALNSKADAERSAADTARDLDAERNHNHEDLAATGDEFERKLTERVRRAEKLAAAKCLSGKTLAPGISEESQPSDDNGRGDAAIRAGRTLRDGCKSLQIDLIKAYEWAASVGR